jgi:hypothetical protein
MAAASHVGVANLNSPGRRILLPSGHGDYLGELLAPAAGTRYAELTAWLIEQFLDGPG